MNTEEQGIKAIIALQKLAGIKETKVKARRGWVAMTKEERDETMRAYKILFPEEVPQVGPG